MKDTLTNNIISVIVILVTAILFMYVLTPYGSATSPDSLSYLDISSNIKNGNGIVATDFSLENFPNKVYREQKIWPPLYPILLSVSTPQKPSVTTVSHLSAVLLFLTILFVYLILKTFLDWHKALPSALALCISIPIITIFTYVWSETLFIPLLVIASWSSILYLKNDIQGDGRKYIYLFLLLLAILGLAFTRYIGIIYFLLLPITYILSRRRNRDLLRMLVAGAVYWLCVGYLLLNNFSTTGSITGGYRPLSDKTVFTNIVDLYTVAKTLLPNSTIVLLIIFIISLLISIFYMKFGIEKNKKISRHNLNSIIILTFICLLYVAAIVTLRAIRQFDDLDIRLLMPIYPAMWVLLFILLSTLSPKHRLSTIIYTPVIFLVIAFPVAGYSQFLTTMSNWNKIGDSRLLMKGEHIYNNYTMDPQRNLGKQFFTIVTGDESVLITNRPIISEFITGIPSVLLPLELDLEKIRAINRLPEKSIMLLDDQKRIDQFNALCEEYSLDAKIIYLEETLLIETPIKMPESK